VPSNVIMKRENVEIIKTMVASNLAVSILPTRRSPPTCAAAASPGLRGGRIYRETGWVLLKSDYVPRAVTEVLRIFD
jgi:hypothetical protein